MVLPAIPPAWPVMSERDTKIADAQDHFISGLCDDWELERKIEDAYLEERARIYGFELTRGTNGFGEWQLVERKGYRAWFGLTREEAGFVLDELRLMRWLELRQAR